mmetsp:Transcript_64591/g.163688  ORF Transcript_64591/g.163688 Transcript_64591/m.163688 type:complete len:108 (-) Transcript_64591:84-407(-)
MEVGPTGIGQLVVHEGFFIGEEAMFKAMAKNGYRYRMRPTSEEYKKGGVDIPAITQIGPLKLKLGEIFGGSCGNDSEKRPEGYRGCFGLAGWADEVVRPQKNLKPAP